MQGQKDIAWVKRAVIKRRIGQALRSIAKTQLVMSNIRHMEAELDDPYDSTIAQIMSYLERADRELARYAEKRYGVSRDTLGKYASTPNEE